MTEQFKRVGEYRFLKKIGKGATSEVFEARKQGTNQRYAIKMMRLKGLSSEQKETVAKEVNIIKSIEHANIVKLVETFETSNNYYLVFEYCERGDLEKYLTESYGMRLPEETAQCIIYYIADAVDLIHSKGIAHRDIKLANILLKKDYQIKLADFGFAKEESNKMLMETYCGTPITMAPEIMQNKPYDKKVDIWSLGVITFQLVYGRLPFSTSEGLPKFIEYVTGQELEIPSQPPMSPEFKELILCSLEKNPDKRFGIKQFLENKWVQEGREQSMSQGSLKKKTSVQQFLRNVSQEIRPEEADSNTEIEILVSQRVNNLIVSEINKILKKHEQTRQALLTKCNQDSMRNLLYKMDHSFLDFVTKLPIRIGRESSAHVIRTHQLTGVSLPSPLVTEPPVCDTFANVVYKYLQRTVHEVERLEDKLGMYQLAYDFLELFVRFELRVIILFANHSYEDVQVSQVIANIVNKKIYDEISEDIELSKGNLITLAMECEDKDPAIKGVRQTLRRNLGRRIDELKKEMGGF